MTTTFFMPRRRVWARVTADRVQLAGQAGHGIDHDLRTRAAGQRRRQRQRRNTAVSHHAADCSAAITLKRRMGGGMMPELVGIINININPVLVDTGGFELTWHGLFTAVGIALGVWLAVRLARRARESPKTTRCLSRSFP